MYRYFLALEGWPQNAALVLSRAAAALYLWRFVDPGSGKPGPDFVALVKMVASFGLKPEMAAQLVHGAGLGLAGLLVAGLGTRVAALATLVLFFWADQWQNPALLALLLILITRGPGRFAVDYLLLKR